MDNDHQPDHHQVKMGCWSSAACLTTASSCCKHVRRSIQALALPPLVASLRNISTAVRLTPALLSLSITPSCTAATCALPSLLANSPRLSTAALRTPVSEWFMHDATTA